MKRLQLFEFEDQQWFPSFLRNYITELLSHQLTSTGTYDPIVPLLEDAMRRAGAQRMMDLCSGSGATTMHVFQQVRERFGGDLELLLTDKYPNVERLRQLVGQHTNCAFEESSVDAAAPTHLEGFRTLFTAFHHFTPTQAHGIIESAVKQRAPIAVFEFTERSLQFAVMSLIFAPLLVLVMTPRVQPVKLGRFLWTYLLPVMPIVHGWDGFVSGLRTYSTEELHALVNSVADNDSYEWNIGTVVGTKRPPFRITYLIGIPK
jgi:hypothetical protein